MHLIAVTLNWKDPVETLNCIESLLSSAAVSKIIVVDNESDGILAKKIAPNNRVSLVENSENLGFASGMNLGLREAVNMGASHILAINNDATIDPTSVQRLLGKLETRDLAMVAPTLLNLDGSVQSRENFLNKWGRTTHARAKSTIQTYLTWACVLVDVETIRTIGYLDTRFFMYYEDVDYSLRASKAGLTFEVCSNSHAFHGLNASHSKAGARVQMYSLAALVSFGKKWKSEIPLVWTLGRVAMRLIKRCGQLIELGDLLRACRIGWTCTQDAHKAFRLVPIREQK